MKTRATWNLLGLSLALQEKMSPLLVKRWRMLNYFSRPPCPSRLMLAMGTFIRSSFMQSEDGLSDWGLA